MAMTRRSGFFGSWMMVCRHRPPAPGAHEGAVGWWRSASSSCQLLPASVDLKRAASSTPAYTVSASVSDGSRCHTRVKSYGWSLLSYHLWVLMAPSYLNSLPAGCQLLPPSSDRCTTCPNQPRDCEAYSRFGSTGEPLTW